MAGLGTLPGASSVLAKTPGASTGTRKPRPQGPPNGQQPGTAQPGQAQPQTFAQMQQQGMARPAPPSAPQGAPLPPAPQAPTNPDIGSQLQQGVSKALQTPSRYDMPQVQQVRDTLTGQLQQQFAGQKKQLDEDMARRGISASSIAGGYQGDLMGQQDQALANMNAQLIQNQAATSAADQSAALGAGQNYQSGQLASQLGLGNLGISQGALTGQYNGQSTLGQQAQNLNQTLGMGNLGVSQGGLDLAKTANQQQYGLNQGAMTGTYGGQQTLAAQEAAANNALGFGNLMGSVNGQQTLGAQQLTQGGNQFTQQLNQQLGISQMGNDTARYGIDTQAQQNQNDQQKWIAQFLASMGYGPGNPVPGATPPATTPPATGGTGGGTSGGTGGGTGGGTEGGTGGGSQIATPMNRVPTTGASLSQSLGIGGTPNATTGTQPLGGASAGMNPNASADASRFPGGPPIPTPTPTPAPGSSGSYPQATVNPPPQFPGYQTPMFGNSGYTGLFGNSPVQYAGGATTGQGGGVPAGGLPGQQPPNIDDGGTRTSTPPGPPLAGGGAPSGQIPGLVGTGTANFPSPGQSPASIFAQNNAPNAQTGAGALSQGGSATGTDPMSLYAQGKIDFATLSKMAVTAQPGQSYGAGTLFQGTPAGWQNPDDLEMAQQYGLSYNDYMSQRYGSQGWKPS